MKTTLLIIDPQEDFCNPQGALFVPGADEDIKRTAELINRLDNKIANINVTMDSHRQIDIAHPIMFVDSEGNHPAPFTIISGADLDNGTWTVIKPQWEKIVRNYLTELENRGRYPLCIWPPHCLIGMTKKVPLLDEGDTIMDDDGVLMTDFCGHAVGSVLSKALMDWENRNVLPINFISKGDNIFTEHYSAYSAEVPDLKDSSTTPNADLLEILLKADEVGVLGEALSHCVANTMLDITEHMTKEEVGKFTLIEDCCSNVAGFEKLGDKFKATMTDRGMKFSNSYNYLAC